MYIYTELIIILNPITPTVSSGGTRTNSVMFNVPRDTAGNIKTFMLIII